METLVQDGILALRALRRRPGFSLVVAVTLGLGIGANTAIFSVIDAVLLRPLPYAAPQRLALVWAELPSQGRRPVHLSGPELAALWEGERWFDELGGIWARPGVLRGVDGPVEEVEVGWVTPGFLEALGVAPAIGRLPTRAEHLDPKGGVMLLSFGLWQRRYGGDPGIVGRAIDFDDELKTVIGVMPSGFQMLFPPDHGVPADLAAWLPWGGSGYRELSRGFRVFSSLARLAPGGSMERAMAEASAAAERVRAESVEYARTGFGLRVEPLASGVVAHVRPTLLVLSGVVAFVLLIACANVANLTLARAADAEGELLVRSALGAGRLRLLRQMLTESALLGALGAGVGLVLAEAGLRLVRILEPGRLPRIQEAGLDARALAFAGLAAMVASLLFGGLAAAQTLRSIATASLHQGARGSSGRPQLARRLLVVSELALSLVLLAGAGLLVRSFASLSSLDLGFEPRGVATMRISLPDVHYDYRDQGPKIAAFYRRLDERLAALPGVIAVGATVNPPLSGLPGRTRPYAWRAQQQVEWGKAAADYSTVTPGWFRAAGVRLQAGRFLAEQDDREHPVAVVVDSALAQRAWPGASAVGQAIRVELWRDARFDPVWGEVVGVVAPLRLNRLESVEREQIYLAHAQSPQRTMYPTLRAAGNPLGLVAAVQAEVSALEKDLPLFDVHLATEHVARAKAVPRFALSALAAFAAVAALLAGAGVSAVMAYVVSRRAREIGIRLALGASPRGVSARVVRQGAGLIAAGVATGLLGALALTRLLSGLLFAVTPTDPATLAAVTLLLSGAALSACWIPARRAARVDPVTSLRSE